MSMKKSIKVLIPDDRDLTTPEHEQISHRWLVENQGKEISICIGGNFAYFGEFEFDLVDLLEFPEFDELEIEQSKIMLITPEGYEYIFWKVE